MSAEDRERSLVLVGLTHRLVAMPTQSIGSWIAVLEIKSPSDAASLDLNDAVALRDWLTERIDNAEKPCKCGHSDTFHATGACLVCDEEDCA